MESHSLPHQQKGGRDGVILKKDLPSRHEAILLYQVAAQRLLKVSDWSKWCNRSGDFDLHEKNGSPSLQNIKVGLLIHQKSQAGEKELEQWLLVTEVFQEKDFLRDEELTGFCAMAVVSPEQDEEKKEIIKEQSIFYVMRKTTIVSVYINEIPIHPESLPQRFLKQVLQLTQVFGNFLGLSRSQWRCLLNGILEGRHL